MFLHSPAMSEGAAGLTPRIDLCLRIRCTTQESIFREDLFLYNCLQDENNAAEACEKAVEEESLKSSCEANDSVQVENEIKDQD